MSPKRIDSAEEILKGKAGEIARLRELGITEFAIITYVLRVRDGQSKEEALRGLLLGRSLNADQELYVRAVLDRLPIH